MPLLNITNQHTSPSVIQKARLALKRTLSSSKPPRSIRHLTCLTELELESHSFNWNWVRNPEWWSHVTKLEKVEVVDLDPEDYHVLRDMFRFIGSPLRYLDLSRLDPPAAGHAVRALIEALSLGLPSVMSLQVVKLPCAYRAAFFSFSPELGQHRTLRDALRLARWLLPRARVVASHRADRSEGWGCRGCDFADGEDVREDNEEKPRRRSFLWPVQGIDN